MDIREIRRLNARRLIKEAGGQKALADRAGVSAAYISQVLSARVNRNIGHSLARRLERGMGKQYGWMDVLSKEAGYRARDGARGLYGFSGGGSANRLLRLAREMGGLNRLAEQAGVYPPYLVQALGQGLEADLARRLEQASGYPNGWLGVAAVSVSQSGAIWTASW
ncbi:MAG: hypothetical protein ACE5FN_09335 [Leptospirillia bacterium]